MAAVPPSLTERQTCHKARDEYFKCLDTHSDKSNCEELKKAMASVCRPTWVIVLLHNNARSFSLSLL